MRKDIYTIFEHEKLLSDILLLNFYTDKSGLDENIRIIVVDLDIGAVC